MNRDGFQLVRSVNCQREGSPAEAADRALRLECTGRCVAGLSDLVPPRLLMLRKNRKATRSARQRGGGVASRSKGTLRVAFPAPMRRCSGTNLASTGAHALMFNPGARGESKAEGRD